MRIVLGFCGLMVVSAAQASERWPADVCRDLVGAEQAVNQTYADVPRSRAFARMPLLILEKTYCGIDTAVKQAADETAAVTSSAASLPATPAKRRATNCLLLRLDRDLATANCD